MENFVFYLLGIAALLAIYALLRGGLKTYLRYRGQRVVTCPETHGYVAVEIDAAHAAMTAETGTTDLVLRSCTRWPERKDCGQECLSQIREAPDDCLLRNMLAGWYEGKRCCVCGRKFQAIEWFEHRPGFRDAEGNIYSWAGVRPESVPEKMDASAPVCWNCYVAENFRRDFPDLVTDRDFKR